MKPVVVGTCDPESSSHHPRPDFCQHVRLRNARYAGPKLFPQLWLTSAFSMATHWSVARWMDEYLEVIQWWKLCPWRWFKVQSGWRPRFFWRCSLLCNLPQVGAARPWWTDEAVCQEAAGFQSNTPLPSDSFINPDRAATQGWVWGFLSHTYQPENDPAIRR